MEVFIILVAIALVTFIPAIVAYSRNHRNTLPIFLICLFAGWTLIGWVGALIWACMAGQSKRHW